MDLGGWCEGIFAKGITDMWCVDLVLDWLREDLFS
jgi:hypothetical protein